MSVSHGSRPEPHASRAGRVPLFRESKAAVFTALLGALPFLAAAQDAVPPPLPSPGVSAASGTYALDMPAASLVDSLNRLSSETGAYLSVDGALTQGKQAPAVRGQMTAAQALKTLLQDSGLEAHESGGLYVIRAVPASQGGVVSLDAVEVRADALDPKDIPYREAGSVSVMTRDDIERFRGTSVGDIFQGMPGVLIGENRNSGGLDVNIRGMQGQGRVPVLVDGARQETTVYRGYAGVASRSYVDPDLIGGIRVDKGPTMDAAGTGAVGGLVSMRTLDARDVILDGESFGIRMRGTLIGNNSGTRSDAGQRSGLSGSGTFRKDCISADLCSGHHDPRNALGPDETMDRPGTFTPKSWAGSLALAKRFEKVDLIAALATRRQGNYYAGRNGPTPYLYIDKETNRQFWTDVELKSAGASRIRGGERVVNSDYESRSALLKGQFYLTNEQQLDLSWLRYNSRYGELMPSQLIWYGNIEQTEGSEVTTNTLSSQYRWQPAGNEWLDLRANLWLTRSKSSSDNYSESMKMMGRETERYRRWGADLSNTMQLAWLGDAQLRYGAALQKEHIDSEPLDELYANEIRGRQGGRTEKSVFVALQYRPVSSVTLDAGWRYTRFHSNDNKALKIDLDSQYCDIGADGKCQDLFMDARGSGSAPMVGLTWEPLGGLQFYARYAEALRMPSLFETTTGFSVSATPATSLKPERARNRELGMNFMGGDILGAGDQLRLKLAYFHNFTSDYLTRTIPNKSDDTSTGDSLGNFRLRNIDSARFHGLELSGTYDAGRFWVDFGGTRYTHVEICHQGSFRREPCTNYGLSNSYVNNMIPPKWNASVTAGTRWLDRRLVLGIRGTFMGRRNAVPESDDQGVDSIFAGPVQWHDYKVFDLFATYRLNQHLSFDFNIDNVTDRYYLDALSLGLVPAPGRTARLSATVQF